MRKRECVNCRIDYVMIIIKYFFFIFHFIIMTAMNIVICYGWFNILKYFFFLFLLLFALLTKTKQSTRWDICLNTPLFFLFPNTSHVKAFPAVFCFFSHFLYQKNGIYDIDTIFNVLFLFNLIFFGLFSSFIVTCYCCVV